jgi:hypothetical protein
MVIGMVTSAAASEIFDHSEYVPGDRRPGLAA